MTDVNAHFEPALETLDRGVVLFAIGGMIFNGLQVSLIGVLLTGMAALVYGVTRNRIANLDEFDFAEQLPAPPGVNLGRFMLVCQWLGSRQLFDGLLGDLVGLKIGCKQGTARCYLREMLWLAIWVRVKEKILTLLWLDRYL